MREGHRANALLVELLLVIFFFMIGSMTLIQLFGNARQKSAYAQATNQSIMYAQNVAEELYGADDPESKLTELGFVKSSDIWELDKESYTLQISCREEKTGAGYLRSYDISGFYMDQVLFTLPSAKYIPGEVSP